MPKNKPINKNNKIKFDKKSDTKIFLISKISFQMKIQCKEANIIFYPFYRLLNIFIINLAIQQFCNKAKTSNFQEINF